MPHGAGVAAAPVCSPRLAQRRMIRAMATSLVPPLCSTRPTKDKTHRIQQLQVDESLFFDGVEGAMEAAEPVGAGQMSQRDVIVSSFPAWATSVDQLVDLGFTELRATVSF